MGILTYIKLAGVILLASAIGAAYWYFNWSQAEIARLRGNAIKLELAIAQSEAAIKALKESEKQVLIRSEVVNTQFQAARTETTVLKKKLAKHDLGYLASQKPRLVKKIINKGSHDVSRCMEIMSGSPLTQDELLANRKSQINSSCSDLANPNYKAKP